MKRYTFTDPIEQEIAGAISESKSNLYQMFFGWRRTYTVNGTVCQDYIFSKKNYDNVITASKLLRKELNKNLKKQLTTNARCDKV